MMQKITVPYTPIPVFKNISFIGDPGCDGLGAASMSVYAKALTKAQGDLTIITGDIVPDGTSRYYDALIRFTNRISDKKVYPLCGNHDTYHYDEWFGRRNYALYSDTQLVIILDNSTRSFSEESVAFCREAISLYNRESIFLLFHIPPPNSFTSNAISQAEWEKIAEVLSPVKESLTAVVTGHVHSFFQDTIDGIPLVVTGGGGARIEFVNDKIPHEQSVYHLVEYSCDTNSFEFVPLADVSYDVELNDENLRQRLVQAYEGETQAHFRYKLYAEEMDSQGEHTLAKLFRALSDSEYYHAKNHFFALNNTINLSTILEESVGNEQYEVDQMYADDLNYAHEKGHGLAEYSFYDAHAAEKEHLHLLKHAQNGDIPNHFYTCTSCGNTFHGEHPERCPVCGAPKDKITGVH